MSVFRHSGALVVLIILYVLASKIGSGLGQALNIFAAFVWTIAIGLIVYLVLFKGMRPSIFGGVRPRPEEPNSPETGEIVPLFRRSEEE